MQAMHDIDAWYLWDFHPLNEALPSIKQVSSTLMLFLCNTSIGASTAAKSRLAITA